MDWGWTGPGRGRGESWEGPEGSEAQPGRIRGGPRPERLRVGQDYGGAGARTRGGGDAEGRLRGDWPRRQIEYWRGGGRGDRGGVRAGWGGSEGGDEAGVSDEGEGVKPCWSRAGRGLGWRRGQNTERGPEARRSRMGGARAELERMGAGIEVTKAGLSLRGGAMREFGRGSRGPGGRQGRRGGAMWDEGWAGDGARTQGGGRAE
ncbi:glycine-rich protein DOT1-like [Gracilinanus agilis]|uniref:glycine-rich protein DOT1-like n=1 Tax=Gracilinanus agilis TaxID=191870 RepID=UPI001CFEE806|nr:glycine-rich protein DOT1-like [Gracilinanus agilis]